MRKLLLATLLLPVISTAAYAEGVVGGLGASRVSIDPPDFSAVLVNGTIGYQFDSSSELSFTPEVRLGYGVSDDRLAGVKVEISHAYGFDIRATLEGDDFYGFLVPSYTKYKVKASAGPAKATASDWEFGIGIGGGYRLTDHIAVEISYEKVSDADVLGAGIRLNF
jgi:opacity protein-like surface antigen